MIFWGFFFGTQEFLDEFLLEFLGEIFFFGTAEFLGEFFFLILGDFFFLGKLFWNFR